MKNSRSVALIGVLAMCITMACSNIVPAEDASNETSTEAVVEGFHEQGKVLIDNEIVTITLEDEREESYYVGYNLVIENKSDLYILTGIDNGSIDGVMTYLDLQGGSVNPGKKSKAEIRIYTNDSDIQSLDDLKNIEGSFKISTNSDGSNSYTGSNERYPFFIEGRLGGGDESGEEAASGQVLLDNDLATITLGDTIEESYYVGYNINIENKSDKYLLVGIDNGSVDGFMTYLDIQGGSVSPGKKSKAEIRIYTNDDSDIKSLDDLKDVEGEFKISTNSDGSNSYTGSNDRWPFAIEETSVSEQGSITADTTDTDAESKETEVPAEPEDTDIRISLGETISSDDWDFTVNNVELTYELKPANTNGLYMSYTPESGKVYIHIDGQYYNKSKKNVCIRDLPVPNADYDDGYTYKGFAIVDSGDSSFDWVSSYVICEPLTTCHYHGLIECPDVIDNSDRPLFVTFKMSDGNTYRYDIVGDTPDSVETVSSPESESNNIYTDAETVAKVQTALNAAGYDCGAADGLKGPHTTEVIQKYQTDKKLNVTGEIDDVLLSSLGLK